MKFRSSLLFISGIACLMAGLLFTHILTASYISPQDNQASVEKKSNESQQANQKEIKPEEIPNPSMFHVLRIEEWKGPSPGWNGYIFWDDQGDAWAFYHDNIVAFECKDSAWNIINSEAVGAMKGYYMETIRRMKLKERDSL